MEKRVAQTNTQTIVFNGLLAALYIGLTVIVAPVAQGPIQFRVSESLNHLVARVGDEIDYLKGKKTAFSPFSALPDQIKNIIHNDIPLIVSMCLSEESHNRLRSYNK